MRLPCLPPATLLARVEGSIGNQKPTRDRAPCDPTPLVGVVRRILNDIGAWNPGIHRVEPDGGPGADTCSGVLVANRAFHRGKPEWRAEKG